MAETTLPNLVKLSGMRDDMYPRYNFLKQRLLSIYPRFKAAIEEEFLDILVGGISRHAELAVKPLRNTVVLILMGQHENIPEDDLKRVLIATRRCLFRKEEHIVKHPIKVDELRGVSKKPCVIVCIAPSDNEQTFDMAARQMLSLLQLPREDRSSCILCNEKCDSALMLEPTTREAPDHLSFTKKLESLMKQRANSSNEEGIGHVIERGLASHSKQPLTTSPNGILGLQTFSDKAVSSSDPNTLGQTIQACLENKVIGALRRMELVTDICLEIESLTSDFKPGSSEQIISTAVEEMKGDSSEPIQKIVNETVPKIRDLLAWKCGVNVEATVCVDIDKIFYRWFEGIHEILIEGIEEQIFQQIEFCVQRMISFLKDLEKKLTQIYRRVSVISFEIKGVFRQAKLPVKSRYDKPTELLDKIRSIKGVYGCGVMLGNLVVHVEEYASVDPEDVRNKVMKILMESGSKYFACHLEVVRVKVSENINRIYESGQCIRVRKSPNQPGSSADVEYSFGTLGCFVREESNESYKAQYVREESNESCKALYVREESNESCKAQYVREESNVANDPLYALTCAHIFPEGCDKTVEIAPVHPPADFSAIGSFSPDLKIYRLPKFDIAAIGIEPLERRNCNSFLKNSDSCDLWECVLFEGEATDIAGHVVYKWGSSSLVTFGLIACDDYRSEHGFENTYNLFIKKLSDSSQEFSSKGDSGSVVCFDEPTEETVQVLSLIGGVLTDRDTGKYLCTYSFNLKKNLEELFKKTGKSFKFINPR